MVAVVLTIVAVFIIRVFIILLPCYKRNSIGLLGHRVRAHEHGLGQRASKGLDPSFVESFPVFKYSDVADCQEHHHSGPLECAVCLSPFQPDIELLLVPNCNHVFRVDCLDPWLKDHTTFPLCRTEHVPELSPVQSARVHLWGGQFDDPDVVRGEVEEGQIGKYKRSKSTGHVVVGIQGLEQECWNKFTLMFPDKEMNKFKRVRSST